jgi:hypothetical protein
MSEPHDEPPIRLNISHRAFTGRDLLWEFVSRMTDEEAVKVTKQVEQIPGGKVDVMCGNEHWKS